MRLARYWFPGSLLAMILLVAAVYAPGLHGGFLFDDYANLPAIGATGPVDNWAAFWRYLTSGVADPTGRPLALLTFLLDARDWPADAFAFKRTNLCIHLLNGVLLALLLRKLGRFRFSARAADAAALLGSLFWMLHPLLVSTTLYVVQREAMLPATCATTGLILWLNGRRELLTGKHWRGSLLVVLGLGGFTLLGTLGKANGALLPAYALLIEVIWLRPSDNSTDTTGATWHRRLLWIVAGVPTVLVLAFLMRAGIQGIADGLGHARPWTMGQRLLTEPRVLVDYLSKLWVPRPYTAGLFNDQFAVSTSLLSPWTTLPACLTVGGAIVLAAILRHRYPAVAMSVLFYFCAQAMESSTLALELYYEHRNYLPSMLMFWPLALWCCKAAEGHQQRSIRLVVTVGIVIVLGYMSFLNARLWGNPVEQSLVWASLNKDSARAQASAAQTEIDSGRPELAIKRLLPLTHDKPADVQLTFNLLGARCATGGLTLADREAAIYALRQTSDPGSLLVSWLGRAIDLAKSGKCPGLDLPFLDQLTANGLHNQQMGPGRRQDLLHMQGEVALANGDPSRALTAFNAALDEYKQPDVALAQAASLGSAGHPAEALAHLNYYRDHPEAAAIPGPGMPRLHAWVLERQRYWDIEFGHMRAQLQSDLAASPQHR